MTTEGSSAGRDGQVETRARDRIKTSVPSFPKFPPSQSRVASASREEVEGVSPTAKNNPNLRRDPSEGACVPSLSVSCLPIYDQTKAVSVEWRSNTSSRHHHHHQQLRHGEKWSCS